VQGKFHAKEKITMTRHRINGLAGTFLVTYYFSHDDTVKSLMGFAGSICKSFATLQALGHPKWREVSLLLPPLALGWSYYAPTTQELRACLARKQSAAATTLEKTRAPEGRILGICR
jgi:uncharacterized protein